MKTRLGFLLTLFVLISLPPRKGISQVVPPPPPAPSPKPTPQCAHPTGSTAVRTPNSSKGAYASHCEMQCLKTMEIFPYPEVDIYAGGTVTLTVKTPSALGGANQCIQEGGSIDWGDGTPFVDPFTPQNDKDNHGNDHWCKAEPVHVSATHVYTQAGDYCASATLGGNYKYDGEGPSCSYDCRVNKDTLIHVVLPPGKAKN
jgi:hypothetical protein